MISMLCQDHSTRVGYFDNFWSLGAPQTCARPLFFVNHEYVEGDFMKSLAADTSAPLTMPYQRTSDSHNYKAVKELSSQFPPFHQFFRTVTELSSTLCSCPFELNFHSNMHLKVPFLLTRHCPTLYQ